jgi:hypothetical protein
MEIKKGIAVSPGISIAKVMVIDSEDYRIPIVRYNLHSDSSSLSVLGTPSKKPSMN